MYVVELFESKKRFKVKTKQEALRVCHGFTLEGKKCGIHQDIPSKMERRAYAQMAQMRWTRGRR